LLAFTNALAFWCRTSTEQMAQEAFRERAHSLIGLFVTERGLALV